MNILPGQKFDIEKLKNPGNEYTVTYMWFWNVPITREKVDSELSEYVKAGIRSIYIVPMPKDFSPENLRTYMDPEYLSKEFFDLVEYTLRKCVKLGITPWIYDEGGWPSGGACGKVLAAHPETNKRVLRFTEYTCAKGEDYQYHHEDTIAAFIDGTVQIAPGYVFPEEKVVTETTSSPSS